MPHIITSFSMDDLPENREILKAMKELAAKDGWSFSRILYEAMVEYAKRHSPGNPQLALAHWTENLKMPETILEKGQKKFPDQQLEEKRRGEERWAKLNSLTNEELLSRQSKLLQRDGSYLERVEISLILSSRRMSGLPEHLP